jgi:hypothetical protein
MSEHEDKPTTDVVWNDTVLNLGTIPINQPVRFTFHYRNAGVHPLLISKAMPTCGCTVLGKTVGHPCLPNQTDSLIGQITLKQGKSEFFTKSIYVMLNSESGFQVLRLKGKLHEQTPAN